MKVFPWTYQSSDPNATDNLWDKLKNKHGPLNLNDLERFCMEEMSSQWNVNKNLIKVDWNVCVCVTFIHSQDLPNEALSGSVIVSAFSVLISFHPCYFHGNTWRTLPEPINLTVLVRDWKTSLTFCSCLNFMYTLLTLNPGKGQL